MLGPRHKGFTTMQMSFDWKGDRPLTNPDHVHHSVNPGEQCTFAYQVYNGNVGFDVSDDVAAQRTYPNYLL